MNKPLGAVSALMLIALLPAAALAQGGKIDDVERTAHGSDDSGGSHDEGGSDCNFFCQLIGSLLFHHDHDDAKHKADSAALPTQTYGRYPWGGPRADERFVTAGPDYRPRFGATGVSWFKDASSSLGGISYDLEGGFQELYLGLNVTRYSERTAVDDDYLWTVHGQLGGLGQMGRGFSNLAIGGRLVCTDTGVCGGGPDIGLGFRILPARPLILTATGSIGGLKWPASDWYLATEYTTTAAVALGRVELGGGWHWLKLGRANAFGGPILTARVWF